MKITIYIYIYISIYIYVYIYIAMEMLPCLFSITFPTVQQLWGLHRNFRLAEREVPCGACLMISPRQHGNVERPRTTGKLTHLDSTEVMKFDQQEDSSSLRPYNIGLQKNPKIDGRSPLVPSVGSWPWGSLRRLDSRRGPDPYVFASSIDACSRSARWREAGRIFWGCLGWRYNDLVT